MSRAYKAAKRVVEKEPVEFDFDYDIEVDVEGYGTETVERSVHFVCKGEVSTLLLSELAYNADLDVGDPEAMKLIRQFFAQAFGVRTRMEERDGKLVEEHVRDEAWEAYSKFFRLATTYGDDELLMEIMSGLVEDFSGRPTMQPSDSAVEPATVGESSRVVSLSRGTVVQGSVVETGESEASSFG